MGAAWCSYIYFKIQKSKVCWGTVVSLERSRGKESKNYTVVASFIGKNEHEYLYRSSYTSSHPGYSVGDGIRIFYDPGDPNDNGVMSFMGSYGMGFIIFVAGVMSSVVLMCILNSYLLMEVIHPKLFPKLNVEKTIERF